MCLTMSKLSTFLCNYQLFMAKATMSFLYSILYSSGINVSDDCLELALKRRIMFIGISAADRNSKADFF